MKKKTNAITFSISDQQIVLGARALAQAMFDMAVKGGAPTSVAIPLPAAASVSPASLPAIGAPYNGGIYAGLSIHDNQIVALALLPGDEKMKWDEGVKWAEKQGGVLPSRIDQLVLFKNLKKEFQEKWYWSGEQCEPDPGCAWYQGFAGGSQGYGVKGGDSRVRAVRRSVIQ